MPPAALGAGREGPQRVGEAGPGPLGAGAMPAATGRRGAARGAGCPQLHVGRAGTDMGRARRRHNWKARAGCGAEQLPPAGAEPAGLQLELGGARGAAQPRAAGSCGAAAVSLHCC